jgi:predicted enzyme related to lactoylglutathione lyase
MTKRAGYKEIIDSLVSMRNPVLVIDVPSLEASLKKIQKAGGKVIMPKQKVMDMGWYARVTDTEGNVIGIWENIKK